MTVRLTPARCRAPELRKAGKLGADVRCAPGREREQSLS